MQLRSRSITVLFIFFVGLVHMTLATSSSCKNIDPGDVEVVSIAANNPETLTNAKNLFQTMLGGENNGSGPARDPHGQRSINWDGQGVPFDMPGNFFAKQPVDRGLTVSSQTNKFLVSDPSNGSDFRFDSINPEASQKFFPFSLPRLFSSLQDTKIDLTFTVPGNGTKALISGFGAMFIDVNRRSTTSITLKDSNNCVLARRFVKPKPGGISLLGLKLDQKIVAKVEVQFGNQALDGSSNGGHGVRRGSKDTVVLDDFFYDEPHNAFN